MICKLSVPYNSPNSTVRRPLIIIVVQGRVVVEIRSGVGWGDKPSQLCVKSDLDWCVSHRGYDRFVDAAEHSVVERGLCSDSLSTCINDPSQRRCI